MSPFLRMSACPGEALAETIVRTRFSTPLTATSCTRNRFGKTQGCPRLDTDARLGQSATGNVRREIGVAALEQADPIDAGK